MSHVSECRQTIITPQAKLRIHFFRVYFLVDLAVKHYLVADPAV